MILDWLRSKLLDDDYSRAERMVVIKLIEEYKQLQGAHMKTLSIVPQPAPEAAPDLNMEGVVATTATVFPRKGAEFWVCNPMDELIEAWEAGEPFVGHRIIGMQAKRVIINPADITRIEEA